MFPPHEHGAPMKPTGLPGGYQPSPYDVCCGRGKKNWNHEGNTIFRKLIRTNVKAYQDATDKQDKSSIVISIVDTIRNQGGRFLKQNDDKQWYDIGDTQAREKVGHSLRDQVNAQIKQQLLQQGSESSPHKRSSPSPESNSPSSPKKPRFQRAPFVRSTSCPETSAAAQLPQQQQQTFQRQQQQSLASQGIPMGGQIVPPVITVRHPSLEQMNPFIGGGGGFRSFGGMANVILPQVPEPIESANWRLEPERSTPEQGRLQMPNFFQPLDASFEPTPIEQMFVNEQKKEDEPDQTQSGDMKQLSLPPRPPF